MHMSFDFFEQSMKQLPSNLACASARLGAVRWRQTAEEYSESAVGFLTLWGADDRDLDGQFRIYAVYLLPEGSVAVARARDGRSRLTPPIRVSRIYFHRRRAWNARHTTCLGLPAPSQTSAAGCVMAAGPRTVFPLRRNVDGKQQYPLRSEPYPFVQVEGDGVHEIAVGPVHAGTIEPGHFRFSVVGEKVLRLEERLGYTHKGIAKRFEELHQSEAHRLAARVSGDSAVAFSWAYCAALEAITQTSLPSSRGEPACPCARARAARQSSGRSRCSRQ